MEGQRSATVEDEALGGSEFSRRVRLLMAQRSMGVRALARAINYDPGYVSRVLNGHKPPTLELAVKIDRELRADGELAAFLSETDKPAAYCPDLISKIASETSEHAEYAEATEVGPSTLEHVRSDVVSLARAYVTAAPMPLFVDMVRVRDRIFRALSLRSHPYQTTELYLLAGALCALMANASLDLGRDKAGDELARAAWTYGKIAAHSGLMGWARGTQALAAILDGRADDAVRYAEEGLAVQPDGMGGVRLYSLYARALAGRPGMGGRAREALSAAKSAREGTARSGLHDDLRGEFVFDEAKQYYYEAATRIRIGDAQKAGIAARRAIDLFKVRAPKDRSYGCEALARVQLALAFLASDDLDGADEELEPIFVLPLERRISSLTRHLADGRRILHMSRFRSSPRAKELDERLQLFCKTGIPRSLPSG